MHITGENEQHSHLLSCVFGVLCSAHLLGKQSQWFWATRAVDGELLDRWVGNEMHFLPIMQKIVLIQRGTDIKLL